MRQQQKNRWRLSKKADWTSIEEMSLLLYRDDPSPYRVSRKNTNQTLKEFQRNRVRGRAVVLEVNGSLVGYALLSSFWSNELGGEICIVDEVFVDKGFRSKGFGSQLFDEIRSSKSELWPRLPVAVELEVTPRNGRARDFYKGIGFKPFKNSRFRLDLR